MAGTKELLSGFYSNPGSQIYEWSFLNSYVNNLCSACRLQTLNWLAGLQKAPEFEIHFECSSWLLILINFKNMLSRTPGQNRRVNHPLLNFTDLLSNSTYSFKNELFLLRNWYKKFMKIIFLEHTRFVSACWPSLLLYTEPVASVTLNNCRWFGEQIHWISFGVSYDKKNFWYRSLGRNWENTVNVGSFSSCFFLGFGN